MSIYYLDVCVYEDELYPVVILVDKTWGKKPMRISRLRFVWWRLVHWLFRRCNWVMHLKYCEAHGEDPHQ